MTSRKPCRWPSPVPSPSSRRASAARSSAGDGADATTAVAQPAHRSEAALYEAITRALLTGRLRPGTPLRERHLAESFGATRGAVRKVLARLAQEGKLVTFPNRGAFVPEPTAPDVHRAYDARLAVEAGLITLLAQRIDDAQLARLRKHVQQERRAWRDARRDDSVRLAGDFHLELADALGNPELAEIVQRLVARTRMYVALFEPAQDSGCAPDEHEAIVDALAARDGARAAAAMLAHLHDVRQRVTAHLDDRDPPPVGDILRAMLADGAQP